MASAQETRGIKDPVAIEQEMGRLERAYNDALKESDREGALRAIRDQIALDGDHPLPHRLAALLRRRGDKTGGEAWLETIGPPDGPGRLYGQGVTLYLDKRQPEALEAYARALDLYAQRRHDSGQAACLTALGNVDLQANRLEQALARYAAAVPHVERLGDRRSLADVRAQEAKIERARGRPREAAEKQRQVLALRIELNDEPGIAKSWQEIGVCLLLAGDPVDARDALGKALEMRRRMKDQPGEGMTLMTLADVSAAEGKDREALDALIAAEAVLSQTKDRGTRAETLARTGKTLRRLGEFERARTSLESARGLAAEIKDARLEAGVLADLAMVAYSVRDVPAALMAAGGALDRYRKLEDPRGEVTCLDTLAAIHEAVGNLRTSRSDLEARQAIAVRLEDPDLIAIGDNNLGVVLGRLGETDAALARLESAEKAWAGSAPSRRLGHAMANRAELLAGQGRTDEARALLERALDAFRQKGHVAGEALVLNQLGVLAAAGSRHRQAVTHHTRALEIARPRRLADEEWRAHIGLAGSLQALGRDAEAIDHARRALDAVESIRVRLMGDAFKTRFLAGKLDLYERVIEIVLSASSRKEGAPRAFEVSQRAKARGLLDLLGESRARMRERLPAELREREQAALDAVSAATQRLVAGEEGAVRESPQIPGTDLSPIEMAEGDLGRLEIEIRAAAPGYAEIAFPRPAAARDVQGALAVGETLLEYFIGPRKAWVWQVTRQGLTIQELPVPSAIAEAVAGFRQSMASPGASLAGSGIDPAAERLAASVLPKGVPSKGRLLIAPDGALHHVPMEALAVKGRFLIEDHDISLVPSATAMLWMRSMSLSPAPRAFLGVGEGPVGPGDTTALPYAAEEIARISGLFDEGSRQVMRGDQVSKEALTGPLVKQFRYVHFATHGLLQDGPPGKVRTGLWLGGAESEAVLTVPEVATLPLDADLVVLSSCRSGAGEVLEGEGIVGLTRAFLHAGSRSVVMSLWDVNDQSAVDLMESFYVKLKAGEPPVAALRKAKLEFLHSDRAARREPYRWAPFVLVGAH